MKKIIQSIEQSRKTEKWTILTVLPKNKIHIINLDLHLGLTKFQVSDRDFLLFCNYLIYIAAITKHEKI